MTALLPFSVGTTPAWPAPYFEARLGGPDEPFSALVAGELDMATAGELQDVLFQAVDRSGDEPIVLDCARLRFIDSSGLNALITAREYCRSMTRHFVLAAPSPRLLWVLDLAGLRPTFNLV